MEKAVNVLSHLLVNARAAQTGVARLCSAPWPGSQARPQPRSPLRGRPQEEPCLCVAHAGLPRAPRLLRRRPRVLTSRGSQSFPLGVVQEQDTRSLPDAGSVVSKHGHRAARPPPRRPTQGRVARRCPGRGGQRLVRLCLGPTVTAVGAGGLVSGSGLEWRSTGSWHSPSSDPGCPGQGRGPQMADLEVGGSGPGQGRPESGCPEH